MKTCLSLSLVSFIAAFACTGFAEEEIVLPSGYSQLDHVTFDAGAYVKTGLTPENGWKIAVDFEPKEVTDANHCLWCARKTTAASADAANWVFFYNVDGSPRFDFYDKQTKLANCSITAERHLFVLDGQTLSIDGTPVATAAMTEPFTAGGPLVLFVSAKNTAVDTTNYASGKFYGAKIWDGTGELKMNIVPCLKSDSSVVFYDTVGAKDLTKGGTFYSNNHKAWKSDVTSGDFTAGSSWADGLAPQNYDTIEFSDVSTTVTFPTDVEQTTFAGLLYLQSPSPASDSPMNEVVFDSRGTVFNYYMEFTTQPFVQGWSWSNNKWNSGANSIYVFKGPLPKGSNVYTPDNLAFSDALVRFQFATNGIKVVQEQGVLKSSRPLHLIGRSNGSDVTNWTEWVVQSGDFKMPLKLRANSRFTFNSPGNLGPDLFLLPNADNTGDNFGGGRAELLWTAGTNSNNYGDLPIGCYGGADALFTMTGTAYYYRGGTGNGAAPNLTIAGNTASHSSPTTPVRAEAIFAGSSRYRVLGRNDSGNQYGNISIACQSQTTAVNATGFMTVRDDASVQCDKGKIRMASSEGARAYLTVEGRGVLKALGTETAKLAAADVGIRMGGPLSVESVVTVRDEATLEVPRIAAIDASTHGDFVRNALVLEGGTLKTVQIEGNALDVEISGGVICASAASTVEKPLIGGLKSLTVADGAKVVIDTQGFDVYVNQDFGEGVTVEKRGTGTLYVAGPSSHALTLVYGGALVKTDESFAFGQIITALDAATWNAAAPANWSDWTSWSPEGLVAGRTAVTVGNDAEMVIQDGDEAKTLTVTADGSLTLSGQSTLTVVEGVSVTGDRSAKSYAVPEGSDVTLAAEDFQATDAGFAKTDRGSLTLDLSHKKAVFLSSNTTETAAINVREGVLSVHGTGTPGEAAGHLNNDGYTSFCGKTYVGGTGDQAGSSATLVLDNVGFGKADVNGRDGGGGGDLYVGANTDAGAPTETSLVVLNKSIICANSIYIGYRPKVASRATLAVTNATVCVPSSAQLHLGVASTAAEESLLSAVVRCGEGSVIYTTAGGNRDGQIRLGCGLDLAFEDGACVRTLQDASPTRYIVSPLTYSRAFGDVLFARGAKLSFKAAVIVNNWETSSISESRKLTYKFDGGVFNPQLEDWTAEREAASYNESHTFYVFKPEYQGLEALAGGMIVNMDNCSRYTIAAPVRGVGELKKTGSGVLVLGKGLTYAAANHECYYVRDSWLKDPTKVVESGVVTVQNAGGVHVAEGTVEVESGATDTSSCFTVDAGCTVDLAGNTVALGALKGEGEVSGGTISAVCFKPLAEGESAATLKDVSVGKVYVDFGGAAVKGTTSLIAKVGTGVTGTMAGKTFRAKAVNTGDATLKAADCTVDDAGNVFATPVPTGLLLMVR